MDNFMDKIAQKLSSQEVIRANAAADAAQLNKLNEQVAEYDACMKEMRKLNLKNMENEQMLRELVEKSSEKIMRMFEESSLQMQKVSEECITKIKAIEIETDKNKKEDVPDTEMLTAIEDIKNTAAEGFAKMEEAFRQADEYVHKENVKVYRNVQAVIVEELEKQSQALMEYGNKTAEKNKFFRVAGFITLAVTLVNMTLLILNLLGIF